MTTNEETIAMGGEKKEVKTNNASTEWKNVAIGGVAGIMFGAGTAYAASKLIGGDETTDESNNAETGTSADAHDVSVNSSDVATVKAGQSFGEAFADARAQVGPGGVFRWHDGVYGTYIKEEWDAMSPEEQRQFTKNAINAAKNVGNGNAMHVSKEEVHDDGNVENNSTTTVQVDAHATEPTSDPTSEPTAESVQKPTILVNNNLNVHVVGAHNEQLAYGKAATVGQQKGEGVENDVFVVNLENDNACGAEVSELYDCCQIEDDETTDISTIDADESNTEMNMDLYTSNDITSDIPGCMNDVDVQLS